MAEHENGERPDSSDVPTALKTALKKFLTKDGNRENGVDRARYETVAGYVQELFAEQGEGHNEIDTRSGEKIRPIDPDPDRIHLEDIAHGLSNVGRFAGQGQRFHSVARHSVHVSLEVEACGGNIEAQRYALVHDAAEAYLSDIPGPVKKSLPGYKHAERRLDRTAVNAFRLETGDEEKELVEQADGAIGKHELSVHFPDGGHEAPDNLHHDPDAVDVDTDDKVLFLKRARDLGLQ